MRLTGFRTVRLSNNGRNIDGLFWIANSLEPLVAGIGVVTRTVTSITKPNSNIGARP
jgi:hypothetical protein